jgi:hypothetical protein
MGEVLIDCPICGIEMRNSIYKTHICLVDKIDNFEQFTDFLPESEIEKKSDS